MSFTSFADRPLRTREQVMEVLVRVADDLAMPDKKGACIIAGMTVSQEAGADRDGDDIPEFWCPANPGNDAETTQFPHDSTSDDSRSSGYFQQQPPWWGTAAQRMDPYESAKLFMASLKRYPYRASNAQEANDWAQKVQGSSFPNAYTKWWQLANDVYDNVIHAQGQPPTQPGVPVTDRPAYNEINEIGLDNGNHASVRSRPPMNFFLHTQEGDGTATDLSAFLRSTSGAGAVSYHYTIHEDPNDHGVTLVDVVNTDLYSWAVLNANVFSINLCFAGSRAGWNRDQWMGQKNAIRVAAYIAVQDARKYNFSTEVILPPYGSARAGISDHRYVTECLHFGNHTDVGGPEKPPWSGFPWDYFVDCVNEFTNNAPVVPQPVPVTPVPANAWPKSASDRDLMEWVVNQLGPGDPSWESKGMTLRDKVWSLQKDAS